MSIEQYAGTNDVDLNMIACPVFAAVEELEPIVAIHSAGPGEHLYRSAQDKEQMQSPISRRKLLIQQVSCFPHSHARAAQLHVAQGILPGQGWFRTAQVHWLHSSLKHITDIVSTV